MRKSWQDKKKLRREENGNKKVENQDGERREK
jgi:hypothetical protein